MPQNIFFADVILPLALRQTYTFAVPEVMEKNLTGKRVVVQFGAKKMYTAVVLSVHQNAPKSDEIKEILSVLDDSPVVNSWQMNFWKWMADYYMCTLGEVMNAALPSGLKLESETQILFNTNFIQYSALTDAERATLQLIEHSQKISVNDLSKETGRKGIMSVVKTLIDKNAVLIEEELESAMTQRKETFVFLTETFLNEEKLHQTLDSFGRAHKQKELLLSFLQAIEYCDGKTYKEVTKKQFLKSVEGSQAAYKALIEKDILKEVHRPLSILSEAGTKTLSILNDDQVQALKEIKETFDSKDVALLYGVTSSGKTEVYFHLIEEALSQNKQVLYLLPEIALTTQMVNRLRSVFGNRVGVYHSKYNNRERLETWEKMIKNGSEGQIILGVRSSVFLPFSNLGLIIVDEEHENTYKQFDPAPRYHARDAAVMLATMHKAKVLLGSATPSIESFYNAASQKYGLISLSKRFGNVMLPKIEVVDILKYSKKKQMHSHFSRPLMEAIGNVLQNKKQVILFQNRRGFSIYLQCTSCGDIPKCKYCDVSLTYHKNFNQLVCHYCGYTRNVITACPECKQESMSMKGFGTEKVEDEIATFFPQARISRLDLDSARSRKQYEEIIYAFESGEVDILIGTQMVTKGLDFENVALVGILNADNMLNFPDFRAFERSFQLMAQVSGRAGRKKDQGLVLVQTSQPGHPIIQFVQRNDYKGMFREQISERKDFKYPPFYRLIRLTIKHRVSENCLQAANTLAGILKTQLSHRVIGPDLPIVGRIQGLYVRNILIKIEKDHNAASLKQFVRESLSKIYLNDNFKGVMIHADVDPY